MASKDVKLPKDFDTGVHRFHKSLSALRTAADKAKMSPEVQPLLEPPHSASVRIQQGR
jgi:hypothetical protein